MKLNLNNLTDIEDNMPFRESVKEVLARVDRWSFSYNKNYTYMEGANNPYTIAERTMKHFLGKPFDDAYSYFCKKVKWHEKHILYTNIEGYGRYRQYYPRHYAINDEGLIIKNPNLKKREGRKTPFTFKSADYQEAFIHSISGEIFYGAYGDLCHGDLCHGGEWKCYIIRGFERTFDSYNDKDYIRLHKEKIKSLNHQHKAYLKYKKEKQYSFISKQEQLEIDSKL